MVAFETLMHDNLPVAAHANLTDEEQSVHYPKIRTYAKDGQTADHVGTVIKNNTLYDTVKYYNLVPGQTYMISGKLMKKDGTPLTDAQGQKIKASTGRFTAETANGEVTLSFNVDASVLNDTTVVVFEKLYTPVKDNEGNNTGTDKEVDSHEDLTDEDQSVHYPEVYTTAVDEKTEGHVGTVAGTITVKDRVFMKNLIVGETYTVSGTLRYQEDATLSDGTEVHAGDVVKYEGRNVTASETFTATKANDDIELVFTVDSTVLEGITVVAFETLLHGSTIVASHADLTDEDQSVHYPKLRTFAKDGQTGTHIGDLVKDNVIMDPVKYWNLIVGETYKISGKLMKKDGTPLTDAEGKEITAETGRFIARTRNGEVTLTFDVDASNLANETVVVFEKLFSPVKDDEGNNTDNDIEIDNHEDLTDEDQSVHYPEVYTTAVDEKTEKHVGTVAETITVKDRVYMKNLVIGKEYTVSGTLRYQTDWYLP